jgi:hypothetical protein
MKLAIGFLEKMYGTVEDGSPGHLIVQDDNAGNVVSTLDELHQWNIGGERRLLNAHDVLRTLPARLNGYGWAHIVECTREDQAEVNAWKEVAYGRRRPETVETSRNYRRG